jgi:beta-lactamase class A
MTTGTVSRREIVLGGAAGLGLGAVTLADRPTGLALAPAAAAAATRAGLTASLDRYMATRSGVAGLVLRDNRNGQYYAWRPRTQQSHSTIKVLILVATLRVAQERGLQLTSTQKTLASRMIRTSDNPSTDTLIRQIGAVTCQRVAGQLGMRDTRVLGGTVFRSPNWWGHSTTTTFNLVQLMNSLAYGSYLTADRRAYARSLMAGVTSTQDWGLGDGSPSDMRVELKNGWGPRSDGYRLNGVGHVSGRGRSYQLAFLSRTAAGYSYGQDTVNRLCRIVFDALARPLS